MAGLAAALVIGVAVPAVSAEAQHGERAITCMNTASGATWQIKVDYDHSTVDTNPASISDAKIAWRDAKDGGAIRLIASPAILLWSSPPPPAATCTFIAACSTIEVTSAQLSHPVISRANQRRTDQDQGDG